MFFAKKDGFEAIMDERVLAKWENFRKGLNSSEYFKTHTNMVSGWGQGILNNKMSFEEIYNDRLNIEEKNINAMIEEINPFFKEINKNVTGPLISYADGKLTMDIMKLDSFFDEIIKYIDTNKIQLLNNASEILFLGISGGFLYKTIIKAHADSLYKSLSIFMIPESERKEFKNYIIKNINSFNSGRGLFISFVLFCLLQTLKSNYNIKLPDVNIEMKTKEDKSLVTILGALSRNKKMLSPYRLKKNKLPK